MTEGNFWAPSLGSPSSLANTEAATERPGSCSLCANAPSAPLWLLGPNLLGDTASLQVFAYVDCALLGSQFAPNRIGIVNMLATHPPNGRGQNTSRSYSQRHFARGHFVSR